MTPAFQHAIEIVLQHEGGHVNHPNDPGGETKFGISKRAHPAVDVAALTRERAVEIYWNDYWDKWGLEQLHPDIQAKVFDLVVNMGGRQAFTLLQRAMNRLGAQLKEDGMLGPRSLHALRGVAMDMPGGLPRLVHVLREAQADYYLALVEKNSDLQAFINGWLRRAYA